MNIFFFYNKFKNNNILDKLFVDYEIIDDGYVKFKNKNLKLYGKIVKINHELNIIIDTINKEQFINKMDTIIVDNLYNSKKYTCYILL